MRCCALESFQSSDMQTVLISPMGFPGAVNGKKEDCEFCAEIGFFIGLIFIGPCIISTIHHKTESRQYLANYFRKCAVYLKVSHKEKSISPGLIL